MDEDASSIPPDHQGEMAAAESSPSGDARPPGDRRWWSAQRLDERRHPVPDANKRDVLPIPDRPYAGLVTYDAKDPATSFPPIEPLRPPVRRPQRAGRPARRRRLRRLQRLRRAVPDPDRRAPGRRRPQVHPVPHHRAVLADPPGAAHRPQPPLGRHGRHHRDRHLGARLQLDPAQHRRPAGRDPQAQRLLDRPVRQVPRGAGVADQPDGPLRRLAHRRRRVRALLRVHRRGGPPVLPGALRRHRPGRT